MPEHIDHNRCLRGSAMATNKPGVVTQQPLFECTSCYEYVTHHADHLRVYSGQCWCETCWEEATHEITDGHDWGELELFKPGISKLVEALERIAAWPDGGNRYGQANIKVFAAETLAAYRKGDQP